MEWGLLPPSRMRVGGQLAHCSVHHVCSSRLSTALTGGAVLAEQDGGLQLVAGARHILLINLASTRQGRSAAESQTECARPTRVHVQLQALAARDRSTSPRLPAVATTASGAPLRTE